MRSIKATNPILNGSQSRLDKVPRTIGSQFLLGTSGEFVQPRQCGAAFDGLHLRIVK